jgi:hypothetical protein
LGRRSRLMHRNRVARHLSTLRRPQTGARQARKHQREGFFIQGSRVRASFFWGPTRGLGDGHGVNGHPRHSATQAAAEELVAPSRGLGPMDPCPSPPSSPCNQIPASAGRAPCMVVGPLEGQRQSAAMRVHRMGNPEKNSCEGAAERVLQETRSELVLVCRVWR